MDGLVEGVAPGLVQETHEGEITARRGHLLAQAVRGSGAHAVEQVALIVAVDPVDVDFQDAGVLDQLQPGQQFTRARGRRPGRGRLDAVER